LGREAYLDLLLYEREEPERDASFTALNASPRLEPRFKDARFKDEPFPIRGKVGPITPFSFGIGQFHFIVMIVEWFQHVDEAALINMV